MKIKIMGALALAFTIALAGFAVFKPEPASVTFVTPHQPVHQDACLPTGIGVLQTAQVMVNEIVQPECSVR